MPKVSVLIPIYKPQPHHLQETLDALLQQTENDIEVHIREEPTEVEIHDLLAPYMKDRRFFYAKNKECLGIGGNWNACLAQAKSPVIAFLFQDDIWHPNYLEKALSILKNYPDVGIVSLNHQYQHEEELWTKVGYDELDTIKSSLQTGYWNGREFLDFWLQREMHPNLIGEPSFVVLRKDVIEQVGPFRTDMPQFLDVEYWLRCLQITNWYFEPTFCGSFRVHAQAASYRNNNSGEGLYDRLTVFEELISCLHGDLKRAAIQSRNAAIETMAMKFLNRIENKKSIARKGSNRVWKFAIRHPLLMCKALGKVVLKKITL